jgi:predicted transposase YbfD/YdcC
MGFVGAHQIFAIERILADPKCKMTPWNREISYYITSLSEEETTEADLLSIVTGHWDAIENGTHHVRDRSFGEDACRIANRNAARVMVVLRNLANGIYQIQHDEKKQKPSVSSWRRLMKAGSAIKLLQGK